MIWNECQSYTTDIIYFTLRLTLSEMVLSIADQAQERPADLQEQLRKEMLADIDKLIAAKP